jgi:hypothetical protein
MWTSSVRWCGCRLTRQHEPRMPDGDPVTRLARGLREHHECSAPYHNL